jgi:cytoskeletal protein CcmA (bactofilin family)
MGLFGRDDRSDNGKPSPAESNGRPKNHPESGSATTVIAKTTHVKGEIKGAGEIRIEGTVKGTLDCSATVLVAQGGQVEGEIRAETSTIAGNVKGDVFASQKIELTPTAEVEGNITSPRILIREGASFEGQVFMTGKKGGSAPPPEKKTDEKEKSDKPEKK